jgi:hypothetical protein
MWPIRKSLTICAAIPAAIFAAAIFPGCQAQQNIPGPEPLAATTVAPDPAMQVRQWEPSAADYQSDLVVAWPTYTPMMSKQLPGLENAGTETFLFCGNLLYSPIEFCTGNPVAWEKTDYKSLSMPPTYHAMPPLPLQAAAPATQP